MHTCTRQRGTLTFLPSRTAAGITASNQTLTVTPTAMPHHSLRAVYGTDSTRNAVHGSDSTHSAARETAFFFPRLQLSMPVCDVAATEAR